MVQMAFCFLPRDFPFLGCVPQSGSIINLLLAYLDDFSNVR